MSTKTVVKNKISAIQKYLTILKRYEQLSKKEIETNLDIRGAVERYLYLATQTTIHLAEAILAYKKYRKPTSMSEVFEILQEEEILPKQMTEKMIKMTGFRNILAHDYEKIDYDIVYTVLHKGVEDIKKFLQITKKVI